MTTQPPPSGPPLSELLERTKKVGECFEWQGGFARRPPGARSQHCIYPLLSYQGKSWRGHRLVWTLIHGDIPKGMCILHKCDNTKCINPDHLYLGTQRDNVRDSIVRNRHSEIRKTHCPIGHPYEGDNVARDSKRKRYCRSCRWYRRRGLKPQLEMRRGTVLIGENVPWSKLTEKSVREIRSKHERGEKMLHLSQEYGVTQSVIYRVVRRLTWVHV